MGSPFRQAAYQTLQAKMGKVIKEGLFQSGVLSLSAQEDPIATFSIDNVVPAGVLCFRWDRAAAAHGSLTAEEIGG